MMDCSTAGCYNLTIIKNKIEALKLRGSTLSPRYSLYHSTNLKRNNYAHRLCHKIYTNTAHRKSSLATQPVQTVHAKLGVGESLILFTSEVEIPLITESDFCRSIFTIT